MILSRPSASSSGASEAGDDSRLIPLINVVFLMLVFIMLAGTLAPADSLPIAAPVSSASGERHPAPLQIAISADGQLWSDELPLTAAQLKTLLVQPDDGRAVEIRADRAAESGVLLKLLSSLQQHGFHDVRLLTQIAP